MNRKSSKKRSMYRQTKRFLAGFLAVLLTVCMLPVDLFGANGVVYATEEQETVVPQEEIGEDTVTDSKEVEDDEEALSDIETGTMETDAEETDIEEAGDTETNVEEADSLTVEETDVEETDVTEVSETDVSTEPTETVIDEIRKEVRAESDGQQGTVHKLDGTALDKKDHVATIAIDDYFTLVCNSTVKR